MRNRFLIILAVFFSNVQTSTASPTDNEFQPCRKLAITTLEQCLIENDSYINDECWADSKTDYTECRETIFFQRMTKIRKAEKTSKQKSNDK